MSDSEPSSQHITDRWREDKARLLAERDNEAPQSTIERLIGDVTTTRRYNDELAVELDRLNAENRALRQRLDAGAQAVDELVAEGCGDPLDEKMRELGASLRASTDRPQASRVDALLAEIDIAVGVGLDAIGNKLKVWRRAGEPDDSYRAKLVNVVRHQKIGDHLVARAEIATRLEVEAELERMLAPWSQDLTVPQRKQMIEEVADVILSRWLELRELRAARIAADHTQRIRPVEFERFEPQPTPPDLKEQIDRAFAAGFRPAQPGDPVRVVWASGALRAAWDDILHELAANVAAAVRDLCEATRQADRAAIIAGIAAYGRARDDLAGHASDVRPDAGRVEHVINPGDKP